MVPAHNASVTTVMEIAAQGEVEQRGCWSTAYFPTDGLSRSAGSRDVRQHSERSWDYSMVPKEGKRRRNGGMVVGTRARPQWTTPTDASLYRALRDWRGKGPARSVQSVAAAVFGGRRSWFVPVRSAVFVSSCFASCCSFQLLSAAADWWLDLGCHSFAIAAL